MILTADRAAIILLACCHVVAFCAYLVPSGIAVLPCSIKSEKSRITKQLFCCMSPCYARIDMVAKNRPWSADQWQRPRVRKEADLHYTALS